MSKLLLPLLLLFTSCNSTNQKNKNELTRQNLKGQVKSLTISSYKAYEKFGEIEKGQFEEKNNFKYNKKGFVEEENKYSTDTSIAYKTVFIAGKEKSEITEYNSSGGIESKIVNKLDEKGYLKESIEYNSDGSEKSKSNFKNDDKGNQIEQKFYKEGVFDFTATFKYDATGKMIEWNNFNADGTLKFKSTFKYDMIGNLIEFTSDDLSINIHSKLIYKYDNKGNQIELESYYSGKLDSRSVSTFDEYNNETGSIYYKSDGDLNFKYTAEFSEFDDKGNWLKKIHYVDDKPKSIIERKIEYY